MSIFTRHARQRMSQRSLSSLRVHAASAGVGKYIGQGKYKIIRQIGDEKVTVVYKNVAGRKVVLSTWKKKIK